MGKPGNFFRDESGATMVEYGLIVGLIALAIIASVTSLGNTLTGMFRTVATTFAAS